MRHIDALVIVSSYLAAKPRLEILFIHSSKPSVQSVLLLSRCWVQCLLRNVIRTNSGQKYCKVNYWMGRIISSALSRICGNVF